MKKILFLLFLLPTLLFGQSYNVRHTVSGSTVTHSRGGTTLTPAGTNGLAWFNVLDYNAKADGSDDSPEIQATINACATAGGGVVYLPKGTYTIGGSIMLKSNVTLKGAGKGLTIIKNDLGAYWNEAQGMIVFSSFCKNPGIEDLTIDGNMGSFPGDQETAFFGLYTYNKGTGYSTVHGLTMRNVEVREISDHAIGLMTGTYDVTLDNLWIHATGDTLTAVGLYTSNTRKVRIINSIIDSCLYQPIYASEGSDFFIENNLFRYNGDGPDIRVDSTASIIGNIMMYNRTFGLAIRSSSTTLHWQDGARIKNVLVSGNIIKANGASDGGTPTQVLFHNTEGVQFVGNTVAKVSANLRYGLEMLYDNINTTISNNDFACKYPIFISADTLININITNNRFSNLSTSAKGRIENTIRLNEANHHSIFVNILNNTVDSCRNGVYIDNGWLANKTTVKNNEFEYVEDYRIYDNSTALNKNIEYKGSASFTTTADRKAVFIKGLGTNYDAIITADQGSDSVHPNANDLMSAYCKADSLIVKRIAGTSGTSGLKFKYVVNNDN